MDDILRRRLIHALKNRRWASIDAERAADSVGRIYQAAEGEFWRVWPSGKVVGQDLFRVARQGDSVSVYDSPLEGKARDVASALNDVERPDSDATGIP